MHFPSYDVAACGIAAEARSSPSLPGHIGVAGWPRAVRQAEGSVMLWGIVVVLLVLWLVGAFVVNIGSLVHLLLVIALVVLVYQLVTGRRAL